MSDDSQNPYATPSPYAGDHSGQDQRQPGLGYVRQIPILAIFTIVQGALLTLMALVCLGYGIFFAFLPGIVPEAERAQMQAESGAMFTIVSAALIGLGVFVLAVAILHIVAGIRVLKYRGRGMIMATWLLGLLASITIYCAPTSIGLAIWGLIVFLNPAVKTAFKMVEDGMEKREVERQFY